LWANYARISAEVEAGTYANEHAFALDVYTMTVGVHDAHFQFVPDAMSGIFLYSRPAPLVSASVDGKSSPQIFFADDILATTSGGSTFTPSPVTHIDGTDAIQYLLDISGKTNLFQDKDALWNSLFYRSASIAGGADGIGQFTCTEFAAFLYPGPSNTYEFANGSSVTIQNTASAFMHWDNITSAADVYDTWFTLKGNMTATAPDYGKIPQAPSDDDEDSSPQDPPPGYPTAVGREGQNSIAGYFIDQSGYEDIAVLAIPSFSPGDPAEFQSVARDFLAAAVAAKKTKIIFDLSSNFGGYVELVEDLFYQFFPPKHPSATNSLFALARSRMNQDNYQIGQSISDITADLPRSDDLPDDLLYAVYSDYNYRTSLKSTGKPFDSWKSLAGPFRRGPGRDTFTANHLEFNPDDPLKDITITGFGNLSNSDATQHFAPKNAIVLTDGVCHSACAAFVESVRHHFDIKTVAVGGRPGFDAMQAIGGTGGYMVSSFDAIFNHVATCFRHATNVDYLLTTGLAKWNKIYNYRSFFTSEVNFRDAIRKEDPTQTPLHFSYKEADCRIFYTPEMTVDQEAVWKTVADTYWGNDNHCISGSLHKRSISGTGQKHGISKRTNIEGHFDAIAKPPGLPKKFNKARLDEMSQR
jgi:hypothetical protein